MANSSVDLNAILTEDELALIRQYGVLGRLPYDSMQARVLVDGIAYKLGMSKRYRGPRRSRSEFRYNECLKTDAVAVKLYRYPNWRRRGNHRFTGKAREIVSVDLKLDGIAMATVSYYDREILFKFGPR